MLWIAFLDLLYPVCFYTSSTEIEDSFGDRYGSSEVDSLT